MRRDPSATEQRASPVGALEYFTNREDYLEAFARHVGQPDGEELSLLVFYGVGGIGKTTLLRRLCADLSRPGAAVPYARFNLENVHDQAQAYRDVLLRLRSDFESEFHVAFPQFDLALAVVLASEGGQPPPLVNVSHGLGQVFTFAMELTPSLVKGTFRLASDRVRSMVERSEPLERWVRRVGGTDAVLALSEQFARDDEGVSKELIRRFAQDLADGLPDRPGKACRGVLFLDTYEALWTGRESSLGTQARALDAWVRLLIEFLLGSGVQPVIAGRDRLTWSDSDPDWEACLDQHLLGGVSGPDAQTFLARRGIGVAPPGPPDALQQAILLCAHTAAPDEPLSCHLLALALGADIVLNTRAAGGDPEPALFRGVPPAKVTEELAARFLKSMHNRNLEMWVEALSLTPRFDETAALALDTERQLHTGRAGWEQLRHYSFVTAQPGGFLRIHRTMREVLRGRLDPATAQALHGWLARYWQDRGEEGSAFYHRWYLDPAGTLDAWSTAHAAALDARQTAAARALLTHWAEVALDTDDRPRVDEPLWAHTHRMLGEALEKTPMAPRHVRLTGAIQHLRAALTVFHEDDTPDEWARAQNGLGRALRDLPTGDRPQNLRQAEDCFRGAARVWTERASPEHWAELQADMGITCAYRPTGDRAANLREATAFFEAALRVWTKADRPQKWADMQNGMGCNFLLTPEGDRTDNLRRAAGFFEATLEARTEETHPRHWALTQHNLGVTYFSLGEEGGGRGEEIRRSIAHFQAALRVHTEADLPDAWAETQNSLGYSLSALGGPEAAPTLRQAISCFEAAQRVWTEEGNPDRWAQAETNKGRALIKLPDGDRAQNAHAAIACFRSALRFHTEAEFPEHWATAQKNLALALRAVAGTAPGQTTGEASACLREAARGYRAVGLRTEAEEAERLARDGT